MIFLPKSCDYDWKCTKSGAFSIIEFECNLAFKEPFSLPLKHSEKVLKSIDELEQKRNLSSPAINIESIRDVYSIILSIIQSETLKYTPNSKKNKIIPSIEYISTNYNSNITNDTLASLCNISTVYFRKIFTEVMGISPMAYVFKIRIEKAMDMLRSDYVTVSDVASSVGYSSVYNFSRDFKKHTGVSPSKFK